VRLESRRHGIMLALFVYFPFVLTETAIIVIDPWHLPQRGGAEANSSVISIVDLTFVVNDWLVEQYSRLNIPICPSGNCSSPLTCLKALLLVRSIVFISTYPFEL
jgi:hypothetical protein